MLLYCLVVLTLTVGCYGQTAFPALDHLVPSVSSQDQARTVIDMLYRKIPTHADKFKVDINPDIGPKFKDTFKLLWTPPGEVSVTGTSGVAAAMGIYYYLTEYCGCHISWAGDQLSLPETLPPIKDNTVTITTNDRFRYYQNVCTVSYSFVWWDWGRWEQEIDWMALSGINLPLAFNGQEAIWQRVYSKMGFSDDALGKHFGGPAFLAWARMGNMHGWGGPLDKMWHAKQVQLQHQILRRMREFGMIPVLPAFAGHVPETFTSVFPNATVSKLDDWGGFNQSFCCTTLLEVTDPLFPKIGKAFIEEYTMEFGTDHIYNADTFNEMTPKSGSSSYLSAASKAVYQGMLAGDPQAIWLMQGWLFQSGFWTADRAKALLTAVPMGHMIVLDLYSEVSPKYNSLQSYYGQPFIWCMLHNFGGTVAMYGALDSVNQGPFTGRAFPHSTMIGTGLTPEGINQNDVVYEFMNEQAWRTKPRNISQCFDFLLDNGRSIFGHLRISVNWLSRYAVRRYGSENIHADKAWQKLMGSVYNCTEFYKDHAKQVIVSSKPRLHHPLQPFLSVYGAKGAGSQASTMITDMPALKVQPPSVYTCKTGYEDFSSAVIVKSRPRLSPRIQPAVWYDPADVYAAWDLMLLAAQSSDNLASSSLFRYDLVDVTRQSLQLVAIKVYDDIISSYSSKNMNALSKNGTLLLSLLSDLDDLLGSDPHFLLGRWIADARMLGVTSSEKQKYEFNARNQVTLWGPRGEILDYANKQWSGLVNGYYRKRWELFVSELMDALSKGKEFDSGKFGQDVFNKVELPFQTEDVMYPVEPTGDSVAISQALHGKYRPVTVECAEYFTGLQYTHSPAVHQYPSHRGYGWQGRVDPGSELHLQEQQPHLQENNLHLQTL